MKRMMCFAGALRSIIVETLLQFLTIIINRTRTVFGSIRIPCTEALRNRKSAGAIDGQYPTCFDLSSTVKIRSHAMLIKNENTRSKWYIRARVVWRNVRMLQVKISGRHCPSPNLFINDVSLCFGFNWLGN